MVLIKQSPNSKGDNHDLNCDDKAMIHADMQINVLHLQYMSYKVKLFFYIIQFVLDKSWEKHRTMYCKK